MYLLPGNLNNIVVSLLWKEPMSNTGKTETQFISLIDSFQVIFSKYMIVNYVVHKSQSKCDIRNVISFCFDEYLAHLIFKI